MIDLNLLYHEGQEFGHDNKTIDYIVQDVHALKSYVRHLESIISQYELIFRKAMELKEKPHEFSL